MKIILSLSYFALLAFPLVSAATQCKINGKTYGVDEVITRDVSIIGGGSAGTYSAIGLKDAGKDVVVIEKEDRLGGNTQTFIDPVTKAGIDYGVIVWHKFDVVYNYFARLNVSLTVFNNSLPGVTDYVDFTTGIVNASYSPGNPTAGLTAYSDQVSKYPYLDYGFNLTYPVPADLLLPFGEFVTKYSLEDALPTIWITAQGIGYLPNVTTIYVMKYIGISTLESFSIGELTTALHDNSLLYESAQRVLSRNVLYNSTVLDVERTNTSVSIIVKTPTKLVLVKSKKLVFAIQPKLANLGFLDLSPNETALFGQFISSQYLGSVIKNTGIPSNISLDAYSPDLPFNIPLPPNTYVIARTGIANLSTAFYLSTGNLTQEEIEQNIIADIKRLQIPGKVDTEPEFVAASVHQPFELRVSPEAIANGFYRDLYALQGQKSTFYTSATFHAQDSSLIWRFTEALLPSILASLE